MKLIYSQLKNWLPDLPVNPKQLRDDLTLIGHFASGYEEIGNEVVLDLEVRQNRADCLGYYGIARDLAVFYKVDIKLPSSTIPKFTDDKTPVTINSPDVYRIQATRLSNIKNTPSPDWLKNFLALHDINTINTLVDLTNYVMLWWGIPCHAFDTAKVSLLTWENKVDQKYTEFTTLDGTKLNLTNDNLLVTDNAKVVSLSFIGGQNSSIELDTTETIIEMAVYNRSRVRSDSRGLKTITEASIRLDKELDTETIPLAFNHLVSLVQEHCNGVVNSGLLDVYPKKPALPQINFDSTKPSKYAGIEISAEESVDILKRLGCTVNNSTITPPTLRKDISLEEDLTEEVVRFHGYNKIPLTEPISSEKLTDVTPKILYLIEKIKDDLVKEGYDEVRSWPLVSSPLDEKTAIYTQNSINSEYPVLRQSIIQSLKVQLDNYQRYKVPSPKFFEIGKIYYQENGKYIEKYALGVYNPSSEELMNNINKIIASPVKGGWPEAGGVNFFETILDDQEKSEIHVPQTISNTAIELTSQIITLDANVTLPSPQDPLKLIEEYSSKIDKNILWSMQITDIFKDKYTFRVSYYNCNDKTAKKIHLLTFNLN